MFTRIAVVNRGEAAVRLIRAVRELNAEHGYAIRTVALHTEAERRAMFVRQADEAVALRSTGIGSPYLDYAELERALRLSGADAVWVGWGFVAEDPTFAQLCADLGITFIGPSPEAMRLLGDKVEAKLLAEKVGVPVAPWSGGPVETRADARRHAQAIGYPLIIKARSGGGGRGIRKVYSEDELEVALERTQGEAERSFGDPVVFIERLVTDARHVEVQIIADGYGNVWAPGVRDCSIQRKNQKVIEESASPLLTEEQSLNLREVSANLVRAAKYKGAATVEYLYQPQQKIFTFLEVNTRLQVEHPITEAATGLDLVKLQIHVADGGALEGDCPPEKGHAIEARLNAEDADNGFAPAPGAVRLLDFPLGPGLRVDTGIARGDVIPPDFDSMVAKIIAWGRTRDEALGRLRTALRETTVVIDGGTTTKSFLLDLLDRPEVIEATADTGWLDRSGPTTTSTVPPLADVALIAAALESYALEEEHQRNSFLGSARGGRPRSSQQIGRRIELSYLGQAYQLDVSQVGPHSYRVDPGTGEIEVAVERIGEYERRIDLHDKRFRVVAVPGAAQYLIEVDGITHRVSQDEAGVVRAPAPAVVVAVPVSVDDEIEAGDTVVVLESMKMETAVRAPVAGRVRDVLAVVNEQVDAGAPLLRVDPAGEQDAAEASERVEFTSQVDSEQTDPREAALDRLDTLRAQITGYDVSAERSRELVAEYQQLRAQIGDADPALLAAEIDVLQTFADLCELSRNKPGVGELVDNPVHSPREHFHSFLQSLDSDVQGLPEQFREKLARALRHYDTTVDADRNELGDAVHRIFVAQQRMEQQVPAISALLESRIVNRADDAQATPEFADVLDLLIVATQVRYPVIGDLARNLRYRLFDEPEILRARERANDEVRGILQYLGEHPLAADRARRIDALVDSSAPLIDLLGQRPANPDVLLEVITRQYYRIHGLGQITTASVDGRTVVTGSYRVEGVDLQVVALTGDHDHLAEALATADRCTADATGQPTVDLYLSWPDAPDTDTVAAELLEVLSNHPAMQVWRRATVTVIDDQDSGRPRQLTFRALPDVGVVEDQRQRDMHPLTGRRLQLWRMKNFTPTRLPAAPETYLFHLVAKNNPKDERLVAFAEIRDIDLSRDESGRVVGFPALERQLASCLDGIRRHQARRGKRRLDTNRVVLYVWPLVASPLEELTAIADDIVPLTVAAGLEKITVLTRLLAVGREPRDVALNFTYRHGAGVTVDVTEPPAEPLRPEDEYSQKVRRSRARDTVYPYELVSILTGREGTFVEHDFDEAGDLVPVERAHGNNRAGIIVGLTSTPTALYPEGMTRVTLFGDPTRALGTVAEAECSRVVAGIDLAEKLGVPVEWFTVSSGATIAMDSGTENMDWVSRALRRIITFTQGGGEINIVVAGINVGAQPYWNAEATMLTHTKGILVMTPDSAMVLTGKQALDYSGGISAEDNFGIGGYDRVMGPNGEAQYWAPNLATACEVLLRHYEHAYIAPGERFPRRAATTDPTDRDITGYPHTHPSSDFTTVGDIFSAEKNPERKKAFDIRTVMRSVVDQDHTVLERWADMAGAETSVVFDAHLAGYPLTVIGIESRPIQRKGWFPADGPEQYTSGTLFPQSSKKTAHAINAASGNRPVVVLANLSGFDGSPESLRNIQLENGAEIGRAIVNFDGPVVFCVISRYHGGAFVVFSGALNDNMEVLAVEGSFASVIGGAPAAAVVFSREVTTRTARDERVQQIEAQIAAATNDIDRAHLRLELDAVRAAVRSDKLGEVASEFEGIHNIERAQRVGSVDRIVAASNLRAELVAAIERGMARTQAQGVDDEAPLKV